MRRGHPDRPARASGCTPAALTPLGRSPLVRRCSGPCPAREGRHPNGSSNCCPLSVGSEARVQAGLTFAGGADIVDDRGADPAPRRNVDRAPDGGESSHVPSRRMSPEAAPMDHRTSTYGVDRALADNALTCGNADATSSKSVVGLLPRHLSSHRCTCGPGRARSRETAPDQRRHRSRLPRSGARSSFDLTPRAAPESEPEIRCSATEPARCAAERGAAAQLCAVGDELARLSDVLPQAAPVRPFSSPGPFR